MKVTIKSKDMKFKFPIYVPLSLLTFFIKKYGKHFSKYIEAGSNYISKIDAEALSEALAILKTYKGLRLVDIRDSEGNIVEITI